jgi:hypothetical protein
MSLDEIRCIAGLQSRREHSIIIKHHTHLDELMYDDYDLDYTISNDYGQDLDEYYASDALDLDEDYARDTQDYDTLAYRHYA